MEVKILLFGITRDIVGGRDSVVALNEGKTVGELRKVLMKQYPEMNRLRSLMIAVNDEYADDEDTIGEQDEIAIIPPVSGG